MNQSGNNINDDA